MRPFVLLSLGLLLSLARATSPILPFPYDWSRFPAAWFGANATDWESTEQLDKIGQYSMAIFGWQHLLKVSNWTGAIYLQLAQAAQLKARHPDLPVFVYAGFGNANGYDEPTWAVMRGASDGCPNNQPCRRVPEPYTGWFLEADGLPVYSMSACEQMGLGYAHPSTDRCWNPIFNVANASARDFFVERMLVQYLDAPFIDGVFFDCFNFAYQLPSPWNRRATNVPNCAVGTGGAGCEALREGTLDLARRIAVTLNNHGKVPIFSNPASFFNPSNDPFWLDEARLLKALENTTFMVNYEFMRSEKMASPVLSGGATLVENMLEEARRGVPAGVHTYLNNETEDPTPHIASFMLARTEGWYFFGSTGWFDDSFHWSAVYDRLGACGKPLGPPVVPRNDNAGVYTRAYEHCNAVLNCSNAEACTASIDGPDM